MFVGTTEGCAAFYDIRRSDKPCVKLKDDKYQAFDSKVEKAKFTMDGTKIIVSSASMMIKGFDMNNGNVVIKKRVSYNSFY